MTRGTRLTAEQEEPAVPTTLTLAPPAASGVHVRLRLSTTGEPDTLPPVLTWLRRRGFPLTRVDHATDHPPASAGSSAWSTSSRTERRKPRIHGAFGGAAEGTRTLDLLHGKQTL